MKNENRVDTAPMPALVSDESFRLLLASGYADPRIAAATGKSEDEVIGAIEALKAQTRKEVIALARSVRSHLDSIRDSASDIQKRLAQDDIRCAIPLDWQNGLLAGRWEAGTSTCFSLVELRRFSARPDIPQDWTLLAGWAFLTSEQREHAMSHWIKARGLPLSLTKKHWPGVYSPIQVISFQALP
jgi:hypothetical protein